MVALPSVAHHDRIGVVCAVGARHPILVCHRCLSREIGKGVVFDRGDPPTKLEAFNSVRRLPRSAHDIRFARNDRAGIQ